ncbi:MAG: hypothetical protein QOH41_745 [Blastocatellia bacterium]|jgi:hypothetical protein|nr:hypothetical protein [Blastocatellia bacterium]
MSETNSNRSRRSVDVIENEMQDESSTFYDPTNPVFAPPRQADTKNRKVWKRRLFGLCVILFLIVGGGYALYLLLRIDRVNVKVEADSRREPLSAKAGPTPTYSENGLSAEAINIARDAVGADTGTTANPNPTPSPNASPTVSPSPKPNLQHLLTFTENSPAYPQPNDTGASNGNGNQSNSSEPQQQSSPAEISAQAVQTRANPTQTLFVEDSQPKSSPAPQPASLVQPRLDKKALSTETSKTIAAVLPPFGTMLPVRTQGVIFSLRNNSYARMQLSRDCQGDGWSLPKGTLLIGHVNGSENDRAYVNLIGYIDPRTNRFVKMTGEALGSDGGSGIPGKRVIVDRNRLKQTLGKVASSGLQVAGMMAGALTGRGSVVVNGAGYRILNPITDEAGRMINPGDDKRAFVKVEAGKAAYIMVADLPKELHAVDAPGEDELARAANSLTDREVMELILFGTPEEVRAALPLMNAEQQRLVVKSVTPENDKR